MHIYSKVRRYVFVQGNSRREAASYFGVSRTTVDKMLKHSIPPGYRREIKKGSILDPFKLVIDRIIDDDAKERKDGTPKQKHTALRIFERLRDEYNYAGGQTIVKDYIREKKRLNKEVFIPREHAPGTAEVDFGEADIYLKGKKERCHYFVMSLPYSDMIFIKAYPAENTEAFMDGHVEAFKYFGGVPSKIVYDNTTIVVTKIYKDSGRREVTDSFAELQSHYLFEEGFCRPARGNEKGDVEGRVGYSRRNYMVPIPRVDSYLDLNADLIKRVETLKTKRVRGHQRSVGERFIEDLDALFPLTETDYDACRRRSTSVNSQLLVRFDCVDYSVPFEYAHHDVLAKGYIDRVEIYCKDKQIAMHERSYLKEDTVYNPLHYLAAIERKPGALDQAAPLKGWDLPKCFLKIRQLLETRMSKKGKREYIQILRLLERFSITEVEIAIDEALRISVISYDAVKSLLLCLIEKKTPKLDVKNYPHLPSAEVKATQSVEYNSLCKKKERA